MGVFALSVCFGLAAGMFWAGGHQLAGLCGLAGLLSLGVAMLENDSADCGKEGAR